MSFRCLDLRLTRALAGAALVGVIAVSAPASAQSDEARAGARAAATQGAQAFGEKRWADSVDLFTRAESLVHSQVHLLYTARSYEKLGQLVKAREAYIKITNEDLPAGASQPIRSAKADAEKELEALEPRVPYVSVVVQGVGPKPVTVTMDGVQVPPALIGVPRPVDPAEHKFEAVAEGMDSAVSSIVVREGRSETVVLTLHPTAGAPPGAGEPVPAVAATSTPPPGPLATTPPPPEADTSKPSISPLTWVAFGVGAVGIGVGAGFAVSSSSKVDDANKLCTAGPSGNACPSSSAATRAASLDDDARSAKTISIVGFVVGGVGLATGATLLVMGLTHKQPATAASIEPWVGFGSAGVNGRF
ncbi:MAG TPA: hypothetical protein VH062_36085 [Polyangiaceae bacterium]|nr:hypothetical protein [Polyangiaceae bacterium]